MHIGKGLSNIGFCFPSFILRTGDEGRKSIYALMVELYKVFSVRDLTGERLVLLLGRPFPLPFLLVPPISEKLGKQAADGR